MPNRNTSKSPKKQFKSTAKRGPKTPPQKEDKRKTGEPSRDDLNLPCGSQSSQKKGPRTPTEEYPAETESGKRQTEEYSDDLNLPSGSRSPQQRGSRTPRKEYPAETESVKHETKEYSGGDSYFPKVSKAVRKSYKSPLVKKEDIATYADDPVDTTVCTPKTMEASAENMGLPSTSKSTLSPHAQPFQKGLIKTTEEEPAEPGESKSIESFIKSPGGSIFPSKPPFPKQQQTTPPAQTEGRKAEPAGADGHLFADNAAPVIITIIEHEEQSDSSAATPKIGEAQSAKPEEDISDQQASGQAMIDLVEPKSGNDEKFQGSAKETVDIKSILARYEKEEECASQQTLSADERSESIKEESDKGDEESEEEPKVKGKSSHKKGRKAKKGKKLEELEQIDYRQLPEFITPPEFENLPIDNIEGMPRINASKTCEKCGIMFFNLGSYRSHWYRERGFFVNNECNFCKIKFLRRSELEFHLKNVHRTQKEFTCHFEKCKRKYEKAIDMAVHVRTFHPFHRMSDCNKCYYTSY